MVTVSPEHPAATLAQSATITLTSTPAPTPKAEQACEAVVRDTDGRALVSVALAGPINGRELTLIDLDDQSLLMTYYFGRGGRDVMLTLADDVVRARLETCWAGDHRSWWLDLRV